MTIRRVLRMGDPLLRQMARRMNVDEIGSAVTMALVADMVDTLHDYGGIGLAAPQVGESVRLAIIEIEGGPTRYGQLEAMPLTVFVNQHLEVAKGVGTGRFQRVKDERMHQHALHPFDQAIPTMGR